MSIELRSMVNKDVETHNHSQRGRRRKARELILQTLYQCEVAHVDMGHAMNFQLEEQVSGSVADSAYFERVALGCWRRREELDSWIVKAADNWAIDRVSVVDRNILRLGIFELLAEQDLPLRVIIDEAIELAKRFSGEGSDKFINGVLDHVAGKVRGVEG
ncbi:MAG: transcription antitermination factor NusB [Magnetococcus sp. DMHC-6]